MKYIIYFLLFLLVFNPNESFSQTGKRTAHDNILTLKNGALLVRLKTSQLKINALKENGDLKEAEEIRLDQENQNKAIVAAFKKNFTFCPVYFFYSNNSNEVKTGNYKGLLLDKDFKTDSVFTTTDYLIGEFDMTSNTQLSAFVIKNKNYEPLESPFPYLIKQNQVLVFTRSSEEIVSLLNKKLFEFYSK